MTRDDIRIIPVRWSDEVSPGDDLAEKLQVALRHRKLSLQTGDILVIKHKIVSKAEGQIVQLSEVRPSRPAEDGAQKRGTEARLGELALPENRSIAREKR